MPSGHQQPPYHDPNQQYGAQPQGYGDQTHGQPGAEGDRGLGSTLVGGAGGAFVGNKLGGGTLGTLGGALLGAVGANMISDKYA